MKVTTGKQMILLLLCFILVACEENDPTYAPVIDADATVIEPIPKAGIHKAPRKESLYEVAWRYGLDYRDLASRNHLKSPYNIPSGRLLYLRPAKNPVSNQFIVQRSEPANIEKKTYRFTQHSWLWPARGRLITSFSNQHKGINIGGYEGEPILAAQEGKVVYCGTGLRGYGYLIILKHNSLYLSAYAHNRAVYVKEGDWVSQGQKIAEMGKTGTDKVMLHFEIRRAGLPVNPIPLLNSNS